MNHYTSYRPKPEITYKREFNKNFYLKDHLGNIRVTIDEDGDVIGYDDYYPFGLTMPGRSMNNALTDDIYKFSGKELDEENNLDWYYFGARYYDPAIARWLQVDPLASKYPAWSAYNYTLNNPIKYFDPDGKQVFPTGKSVVNEIKRQFNSSFDKNVVESIEAANEVAREATIKTTAEIAPLAETTSKGLTFIAPFTGPLAPKVAGAALLAKGVAFTCKAVNTAVGGNDFTTNDMIGDVASAAVSSVPGAQTLNTLTGAVTGAIVDELIDGTGEKEEKEDKKEENDGTE